MNYYVWKTTKCLKNILDNNMLISISRYLHTGVEIFGSVDFSHLTFISICDFYIQELNWYSCHKFNIKNLKFLVVWKKWLSKWTAKFCGGMGNQTDFFSGLKFWSKIPIDLERFFITDPTNTHQKISFCFITLLPKLQISLMSSWLEIKSFTI